ncbi:MAG: aspartate-semialdehyde dehydrogenase [Pseudomonadota bacterium]
MTTIAIAGATGAVGEALIEILESRQFPVSELYLLASERSAGKRLQFHGKSIMVQDIAEFDFSQAQIGLFSAGSAVSEVYAPKAAEAGCVVVDNTSFFRYEPDIPLIVPEVNGHRLEDYRNRNIIANPNCSTIQMLVALKPIHDEARITRINVATYQAVSGAGAGGIKELAGQTANLLNAKPIEPDVMPVQIAFNAIPQIDSFQDNGYTKEEMKMVWETQKIFEDDLIQVNPTCVRIPVFYGHSEAVHIETEHPISAQAAMDLLAQAPGVELLEGTAYPTAVEHAAGTDPVFVGRVREDISHPSGLNLWVVSDNVRKGAALNSVQIAEMLVQHWS